MIDSVTAERISKVINKLIQGKLKIQEFKENGQFYQPRKN